MAETELRKFRARETWGDKDDTVFKTQVPKVCAMQFGDDDKKDFRAERDRDQH